jgi:Tol biopolymer transport system component
MTKPGNARSWRFVAARKRRFRTFGLSLALGALALLVLGPPSATGTSRHGGRLLVYSETRFCSACTGLQTVNGDGSGLRWVHLMPSGSFISPGALSPDGARIAYFGPLRKGTVTVRVGSPNGAHSRVITRLRGPFRLLVWSPDSRRIAVATSWQIWVLGSARGSSARRIVRLKRPTIASLAWSPRGSRIAFLYQHSSSTRAANAIYVVRPNGTGLQRVARPRGVITLGYGGGRSWSPDDGRIVFSGGSLGHFQKVSVYSVDVRTRVSSRLGRGYEPLWAPRGGWIAFALPGRPSVGPSIYVSRPDGSGRKVLGKGEPAAWSPDGTEIAAHTSAGLVAMQLNRTGRHTIGRFPEFFHVDWSR